MGIIARVQRSTHPILRSLRPRRQTLELPRWNTKEIPPYGRGVAASLLGQEVWFASPDATLETNPESLLCLLAPWCSNERTGLRLSHPRPSQSSLANVRSAIAMMAGWWGGGQLQYHTDAGLMGDLPEPRPPAPAGGALALFFSGGVDSFYSLMQHPDIGALIFVVGFDIGLDNRAAWEPVIRAHREVAEARGVRLIRVFTNLRQHRLLRYLAWARYHGAALAAVGHLLRGTASRWIISSSYQQANLMPWGSHPELDWRWGDERSSFIHFGVELWRAEKLVTMADQDLVHRHLHVCFSDPDAQGNCGRCEKCVRTRLIYHCDIPGRSCRRMPSRPTLVEAIDGLKRLKTRALERVYGRFRASLPSEDPVAAALERLLYRSRCATLSWWRRWSAPGR